MTQFLKSQIRRVLPRSLRPHSILAGPLRGATIYTSWHDYPAAILGATEKPLLAWFGDNVSPGETWIDIGAHYGYTSIALSRLVGPRGRVFAFEPVPGTAACIARTRELNGFQQLRIVPLGLGSPDSLETRRLPVVRGMADSTVPQNAAKTPISVASFDMVWGSLCGGNPLIDGVKIDVQGMELEVIEGMLRVLACYRPILIVEFHSGVERRLIVSLLRGCGYDDVGRPIEPAPAAPAVYADDKSYVFVRRNPTAPRHRDPVPVGSQTFS